MKDKILSEIKPLDILNYYGIKNNRNKFLCPFHADKHPSMSIKGDLIRCWVCMDKSVNVIDFVMQYENISFGKAIEKICDMFGIANNVKNAPKIRNYKKDLENINNKINFCKNIQNFDFIDKEMAINEVKKLENEKNEILSNDEFVEIELEKVRKNVINCYRANS